MTGDSAGWSFASAREPAGFGAAEHRRFPEQEHAFGAHRATLCGIPEAQLDVYLHYFQPEDVRACPRCREKAAAVPTVPCSQERLHDSVLAAAPGPLRTRLLDALRTGAQIDIWISGPANRIAVYAHADHITDEAQAVTDLLATHDHMSIARVVQPSGQFIVLLPQHTVPIIVWATN